MFRINTRKKQFLEQRHGRPLPGADAWTPPSAEKASASAISYHILWLSDRVEQNIELSTPSDRIFPCNCGFDGVCCFWRRKRRSIARPARKRRGNNMKEDTLLSMREEARILRQALAEAYDHQDTRRLQALCSQIDALQLRLWREAAGQISRPAAVPVRRGQTG